MSAKRRRQRARRNKQVRKQANAGTPSIVPAQLGAESKSRLDRVIARISSIGLKLRNKLTELEFASLVSIPLSILLSLPAYFLPQTAPSLYVTLDDVLDKLKAHDANFEKDPL